jgi:L-ascorbate metabolism protein UlaG (beta-lactamase superfamily)
MQSIQCDIALLPVSGTYVMTAEEAAQAAEALKPKIAVPMHYGAIVGSLEDAKKFKSLVKSCQVEIV